MVKSKKIYIFTALFACIIALLAAVAFGNYSAVRADDAKPDEVKDKNSFVYTDSSETVINGFELPDGDNSFTVAIPEGVTEIAADAFKATDNEGLKTRLVGVKFPSTLTVVGDGAFSECESLLSAELNEGLKTIGASAFNGTALSSVEIPASVTSIGGTAFRSCVNLSDLSFAKRAADSDELTIFGYAFQNCAALRTVKLPDNAEIRQNAFFGCASLSWVYVGKNTRFYDNGALEGGNKYPFFPTDRGLKIVFPTKSEYDATVGKEDSFGEYHGAASTYIVEINRRIKGGATVTDERLHGEKYNLVRDENTDIWNVDTHYATLPAQDAAYASTVWYTDEKLTNAVSWDDVNALLETKASIDLYCYETISAPELPAESPAWVYDKKVSYDINSLSEVLNAMGCKTKFTDAQLGALKFSVVYAKEDGKVSDTPDAICENGVYNVTVALDEKYGQWAKTVASTVTVNVNTGSFNIVLIILIIVGVLAVAITVSTAVIRKKVQKKAKKKQISSAEVLEKFRATGGETDLK